MPDHSAQPQRNPTHQIYTKSTPNHELSPVFCHYPYGLTREKLNFEPITGMPRNRGYHNADGVPINSEYLYGAQQWQGAWANSFTR
jgi:hypothetical protein